MNIAEIIAAVGGAGATGASITALFKWLSARKKNQSDAAEVVSKAAIGLLEPLRSELELARRELEDARTEIHHLRVKVNDLSVELESTRVDLRETRADLQIAQMELRRLQSED